MFSPHYLRKTKLSQIYLTMTVHMYFVGTITTQYFVRNTGMSLYLKMAAQIAIFVHIYHALYSTNCSK
jgi:hypothetical protein